MNSMPEAEAYLRSELSVTCDIADLTGGAGRLRPLGVWTLRYNYHLGTLAGLAPS